MISWNARFILVALLLAGTGLFLHIRAGSVVAPPRSSLALFPIQLRDWVGNDIPIAPEILKKLGQGEFLQRAYEDQVTREPEVFPNQHAGQRRHLPEDCLAGSGWSAVESGTTTLSLPGHKPFLANRYLATRGTDRQLVLFWFWGRGRGFASGNWADFYLVFDSLRLNRRDDALIRINTPLQPEEDAGAAQRRLLSFAALISPIVDNYIPR